MSGTKEKAINLLRRTLPVWEWFLAPFTLLGALLFALIRRGGIERLPLTRRILLQVGVFPISRHYYEPQFDHRAMRRPLDAERPLPGIDWNEAEQIELLGRFHYADELLQFPERPRDGRIEFHYDNAMFPPGDAEILYSMVRHFRPGSVIEIGSGNSTLMVVNALQKNAEEEQGYRCRHICIEPYEMPWLEQTGVTVLRERVESVDRELFATLQAGDILFIDSSHMIRPQGDVLAIYLEILPLLRPGVLVHIHDIFSPQDYPREWVVDEVKFWNEQYLLEAFLTMNREFRVVAGLSYLKLNHYDLLCACCPVFARQGGGPGSMWLRREQARP
ncbi:class I SAM-dependent methyltransferase [Geomonas oryzisoli]|uniref:Class I SAM-dependent methyltransferase n=1 Tax=Geomonas oryzisoli TaxID=2847992 RepID=A0ABX8J9E4_9BACT|nr:class I SAM-dependent methyltransferase [Geomonas oryzisoli]QWV95063.1 class I SAM-dependent methyltransferase [Geomonas oryzisoli]